MVKSILIVDDSKDDQQLIARLFKRSFSFIPTFASSFPEARENLCKQQFDIVVLDGYLPDIIKGGYGYQLIPDIQKTQSSGCIILMISGEKSYIKKGLNSGAHFGFNKRDIEKDVKLTKAFELVPIQAIQHA